MPLILLLIQHTGYMGTDRYLIQAPKMREIQLLFFGLWLVSRLFEEFQNPEIQNKIVQHFFHQIKVRQAVGRKDSIQTVIRTSRRLDSFLYEVAQIFKTEIKKSKTYSG